MTREKNSLNLTQSDNFAEVLSGETCHIVLERCPPDYVEKISRYLDSCAGLSGQDKGSNEAAEAESDSGDSLFITQKVVPEAVRSGRRHIHSLRSKPASPRDLEKNEEDTSSSTSNDEESKSDKKKKINKLNLLTYNFPFLKEQKSKLRFTRIPDQGKNLLNYTMGGFFKCVRELRLEPKSSLPTVDTDGEDISPLSEEDEERPEVEDIKVVERKHLVEVVSPSKAKRQQSWSTPLKEQRNRKASNGRQVAWRGRRTKMLHKIPDEASTSKVTPTSSDTERCDDGEALVQEERNDQHATSDGNFVAQTGTPKRRDALNLQNEEDSDATFCELPISPKQSTQKDRDSSTPVKEPQTDVCNETEVKKRKKDEGRHENVEEIKCQNQEEPDDIQRQEKRDIPLSKEKKKKKKKDKSAAENDGQEVDESDRIVEESNMEDGAKKKKRDRSGEGVEQSDKAAESLNAEIQKKKKKKRKKEEGIGEHGQEEPTNGTVGLPPMSTERFEESGNCFENSADTLDSSYVKRKKQKKKRQPSSNDATQDGDESVCLDSVPSSKGTSLESVNSSYTAEENEQVDKTQEDLGDQNAELVTKKKKKKKSKDKAAQNDDSVSVQEKKKTSSFLVADAEEDNAQAHGTAGKPGVSAGYLEELNAGVTKKKKKKRKMSIEQDSVEKDCQQDFEEPKSSALPANTGVKKKRTGSESESPMEKREADAGLSPTDEAVVSKTKKRKSKDGQEAASEESAALDTCSSLSHKKKGKHGGSDEIAHGSSAAGDQASKETLVEPGNQEINETRAKKKKKKLKSTDNVLLEGNSLTESAELESRGNKKEERNKRSAGDSVLETSADNIMKNKHRKVKRTLLNPSEDFLSDC